MGVVLIVAAIAAAALLALRGIIGLSERIQRPGNERYRAAANQRIDESLGTWVPDAMVIRDRKRGYGRWAKVRRVQEP